MARPDKKQRQKAKRQAKKRQARRLKSVSPVKRLGAAPGELECWMSGDVEEFGQIQLFAYRRAAGLTGVACFLVDLGVVGLKDAWIRLHIDRDEFESMIDRSNRNGVAMRRATVEEVRRWVAGGARWAYDNGMRLPGDWTRAATLIGGVGDWASADVSAFVMEFAGHPADLRQRLIGEPFETYITRTDVSFVFNKDAPYSDPATGGYSNLLDSEEDDDDEDDAWDEDDDSPSALPQKEVQALLDRFTPSALALVTETTTWLSARGEAPSEELFEAWREVMFAAMVSKGAMPSASDDELGDLGFELMQDLNANVEPSRRAEHRRAVGLVLDHLQTNPELMQEAVLKYGLGGDGGGEEADDEGDENDEHDGHVVGDKSGNRD